MPVTVTPTYTCDRCGTTEPGSELTTSNTALNVGLPLDWSQLTGAINSDPAELIAKVLCDTCSTAWRTFVSGT